MSRPSMKEALTEVVSTLEEMRTFCRDDEAKEMARVQRVFRDRKPLSEDLYVVSLLNSFRANHITLLQVCESIERHLLGDVGK